MQFAKLVTGWLNWLLVGYIGYWWAKFMRSAKFVWSAYFFLFLISVMTGHAAIMWCAMFVRSAKSMRCAKFFFSS